MDQVIDSLRFSNKAGQLRSSNCQESHGCHGVTARPFLRRKKNTLQTTVSEWLGIQLGESGD